MATFIQTVNRIATELRRSNLTNEIKQAINDAIDEASKTRFYFNEMRGQTFNTVVGQEYYSDMGLVEIDALYYLQGTTRYNLALENNLDADMTADGNATSGQLQVYSRQGLQLRLYPIPNSVVPVYADGYGKLTPWPMANDADTNNWLTSGERYIRTLAKAYLLKDIIRDYSEATVLETLADGLRDELLAETATRLATGVLKATRF